MKLNQLFDCGNYNFGASETHAGDTHIEIHSGTSDIHKYWGNLFIC